MVTEGLPVPCSSCFDESQTSEQSKSARPSLSNPEDLAAIRRLVGQTASSASDKDIEAQAAAQADAPLQPHRISFSSSAIHTPPQSPRLAALQIGRNGNSMRRDSSFRKTYDENDRKRAIPCENCALTLPKKVKEELSQTTSGSPTKSGKADNNGPILRTRKPYERVATGLEEISPRSTPSDSDESEQDPSQSRRVLKRTTTSSSVSSFASSTSQAHNHYLDYTSSHDPISSHSFSILRASCLRTLSCETLPPNNANTSPSTPTSPVSWQANRSFSNSAPLASTSGGPIFFGDPQAGYTTAYIFRIPDPYARGRRRVYAFICLSSAHERVAMRAFSFLSAAFRDLASWIQSMAEAEADRCDCTSPNTESGLHSLKTSAGSMLQQPPSMKALSLQDDFTDGDRGRSNSVTPPRTSAFLSGRAYDPDGFPRRGLMGQLRSRGLAELVGLPDFFIELHARFVALLAQLAILFSGGGAS